MLICGKIKLCIKEEALTSHQSGFLDWLMFSLMKRLGKWVVGSIHFFFEQKIFLGG